MAGVILEKQPVVEWRIPAAIDQFDNGVLYRTPRGVGNGTLQGT